MQARRSDQPYILYGAWSSYYTAKVRSYLRKKGLYFIERVPGVREFRSEILIGAGTHHIPVVRMPDGMIVQDSTLIIDYIEERQPIPSAVPNTPRQAFAALLLELFAQEGLIRVTMHYRWNFAKENGAFLRQEFGRSIKPNGSQEEIEAAGARVCDRMGSKLPGLGIDPHSIPEIERAFDRILALLENHFRSHPYLLGGLPSRADHALMAPIFGHLLRDPYPAGMIRERAPAVARWAEHMNVADLAMPEFPEYPIAFSDDDGIPETLIEILRFFTGTYGPELRAIADAWNAYVDSNPGLMPGDAIDAGSPAQPTLPERTFALGAATIRFTPRLHSLWMLQRAVALSSEEPAIRALTSRIEGDDLLGICLKRRLVRRHALLTVE